MPIDCKNTLYQMMRKPVINRATIEPKRLVYVFDEFDIGVRKLYSKSLGKTNYYNKWIKKIGEFNDEFKHNSDSNSNDLND